MANRASRSARSVAASVVVLTAVPAAGQLANPRTEGLIVECKDGKRASCEKLVEIARNDKDRYTRLCAVRGITDPAPAFLADVAQNDPDGSVRGVAAERITDQAVLEKIVLTDTEYSPRAAALGRISNQALLAKVAQSTNDDCRRVAIEHLTDQAVLFEIVRRGADRGVRRSALRRLTDQGTVETIGRADPDIVVQSDAAERLREAFGRTDVATLKCQGTWVTSLAPESLPLPEPESPPRRPGETGNTRTACDLSVFAGQTYRAWVWMYGLFTSKEAKLVSFLPTSGTCVVSVGFDPNQEALWWPTVTCRESP